MNGFKVVSQISNMALYLYIGILGEQNMFLSRTVSIVISVLNIQAYSVSSDIFHGLLTIILKQLTVCLINVMKRFQLCL